MFHWLFLDESALSPAEHAPWKISALRIILASTLTLEALIAICCASDAIAVGAHHLIAIAAAFCALLGVAFVNSARRPGCTAAILIATIYAASAAISLFGNLDEIAMLGIIAVYATPIIARLFLGRRIALALMLVNVIPFFYHLRNSPLTHLTAPAPMLYASHGYVHTAIFLFFNIAIPLTIFRLLHALDASARRCRESSAALATSHAQYREFFENAGSPIVLCNADATILQANRLAGEMIGRSDCSPATESLFDWLKPPAAENPAIPAAMAALENAQGRQLATRDGRRLVLEQVTKTARNHFIVVLRDASSLNEAEQALQRSQENVSFLSRHDALTKLPNRKSLRSHLAETLPRIEGEMVIAMVSIRLNSIRLANEKFGALIGDAFIQDFSEELRKILPLNAFCARLRSIVFSIVLPPAGSTADVVRQVERLRQLLPQELSVNGHRLIVQFSTGIALARPGDTSPEELMQRGEVALDSARRLTEGSVALFDEADAAQISRRIEIELGIVAAIKHGEFRLVYQPKVNGQRDISGLEALIRWHSPTLGEVSPAEFIPVAESSGLIHGITRFVIEETCGFIRRTLDGGRQCPPIALNLSAIDIIRHDLLELIDAASARHATPPELLEFEITETGLIGNEALAIAHLHELNKRGNRIAIDDFGTGYSSFSKLSNFPVSSIKIDQSFVARIGQCEKSESIIRAIVSLAGILSCTSIAEGVENEAQERFLKSVGCQEFQGYYYYRPLEVAQLGELDLFLSLFDRDLRRPPPKANERSPAPFCAAAPLPGLSR
jgi:diguanylate cyclase (GGDEF)-like protein